MRTPFRAIGFAWKHRRALSVIKQLVQNFKVGKLKTPELETDYGTFGGTKYTGFKTGFKF